MSPDTHPHELARGAGKEGREHTCALRVIKLIALITASTGSQPETVSLEVGVGVESESESESESASELELEWS